VISTILHILEIKIIYPVGLCAIFSLHSFAAVKQFSSSTTHRWLHLLLCMERLFSSARQIATPRRNQLSDISFEKLLMLKISNCE